MLVKRKKRFFGLCIFLCISAAVAAEAPSSAKMGSAKVAPDALAILHAMSDYLSGAERFTVQVFIAEEEVLADTHQKLQYHSTGQIALQRPNRIRAEVKGDALQRGLWYDGGAISVLDGIHKHYAVTEAPDNIDAALAFAGEHFGVSMPLTNFMNSNPYAVLTDALESGVYIGMSDIQGHTCHHLAFQQADMDWQIWVDAGYQRVPRKLVVTYKQEDAHPQYTAILSEWRFAPYLAADTFVFHPPVNARRINFLPLKQPEVSRPNTPSK